MSDFNLKKNQETEKKKKVCPQTQTYLKAARICVQFLWPALKL